MECPNCTFQNTPGLPVCVRCQSRLDLGDISIEPPRASSSAVLRAGARASYHARLSLSTAFLNFTSSARNLIPAHLSLSALLWSIVPGLGQFRSGHRLMGRLIAFTWLILMLLAALNIGGAMGYFFALAAIGLHCFAVSLILAPCMQGSSLLLRAFTGLLTWCVLVGTLYYPATLLSRQCFMLIPVDAIRRSALVKSGDVLVSTGQWTNPDAYHRGDIVYYRIDPLSVPGAYVTAGAGIERIVGLPGDHVRVQAGHVFVNGVEVPSATALLADAAAFPDFEVHATTQEYVIIPSLANWYRHGQVPNVAKLLVGVSRVPLSRIEGRVFFRVRPWSRISVFTDW